MQNNKILVVGGNILCGSSGNGFNSVNGLSKKRLVLLNSDGSVDNSFNVGTGFNDNVWVAKQQSDGKILLGGDFTTYNGSPYNKIIRLNMDGSVDNTFNHGGSGFGSTSFEAVNSIIIQPDNKLLLGGGFTTFNGTSQNCLIRLNSDGTKDTSFDIASGFNSAVNTIAMQPDGKILLGGYFSLFNGTSQKYLIRLNNNGTKDTSFDIGTGFDKFLRNVYLLSNNDLLVSGKITTYNGKIISKYFTKLQLTPDRDHDTINDSVEDAAPNGGDANNDGTLDSLQKNVASYINPITNNYQTIEVDSQCSLSNVSTIPSTTNSTQDTSYNYPLGLYNFTASCGTAGYTTNFKAYYYNADTTKNYTLRKYNPNTKTYSTIDNTTLSTTTIATQPVLTATYTITDGSPLDTDNQANGTIVDPAGPALTNPTNPNPAILPTAPNTGVNSNKTLISLVTLLVFSSVFVGIIYK